MRALAVALVLAVLAVPALADDAGEPPVTFHKGQVGVSARFGVGLRGIAPRNDQLYCGETDATARHGYAPVCTGRAPLAIDLEAAYGITSPIELLFAFRIGLEKDFGSMPGATDGSHTFELTPGARFFFSEAKHTKLFVQPMLLVDATAQKTTLGGRDTEYGLRSLEGYWIDFHRTYGLYVYAGETLGFTPWLAGGIEAGFGIQGRYP